MNNIILGENINVTLVATETKSKNIIAIKLHQQFAHPSPKKLLRLLNSAGNQWQSDEELHYNLNIGKYQTRKTNTTYTQFCH